MYSIAQTPKIGNKTKMRQHAPCTKIECDYLSGWIKQWPHMQKSHPKWWTPETQLGNAEEEEGGRKETIVTFFFSFWGWLALLRPSVHMLPWTGWCGADHLPFSTVCWWLSYPVAMADVTVATRKDNPRGCGGWSVLLLCSCSVPSQWCQFTSCALVGYSGQFAVWI